MLVVKKMVYEDRRSLVWIGTITFAVTVSLLTIVGVCVLLSLSRTLTTSHSLTHLPLLHTPLSHSD